MKTVRIGDIQWEIHADSVADVQADTATCYTNCEREMLRNECRKWRIPQWLVNKRENCKTLQRAKRRHMQQLIILDQGLQDSNVRNGEREETLWMIQEMVKFRRRNISHSKLYDWGWSLLVLDPSNLEEQSDFCFLFYVHSQEVYSVFNGIFRELFLASKKTDWTVLPQSTIPPSPLLKQDLHLLVVSVLTCLSCKYARRTYALYNF